MSTCRLCHGKHSWKRCEKFYECPVCERPVPIEEQCQESYCKDRMKKQIRENQNAIKNAAFFHQCLIDELTQVQFTDDQAQAIINVINRINTEKE